MEYPFQDDAADVETGLGGGNADGDPAEDPADGDAREKRWEELRRRRERKMGLFGFSRGGRRQKPIKRRKYRLRPEAKHLYIRLGIVLGALCVAVLALRLTLFKTTFTLQYDSGRPFGFSEALIQAVGPERVDDLIVMDAAFEAGADMQIQAIHMSFAELISDKQYRSWELEVRGGKAKLHKGKKSSENYTTQRHRFPPLGTTLEALGRIPLQQLGSGLPITEQQLYSFSTNMYNPNINNPLFTERALEASAKLMLVASGGEISSIDADWKPITDYMTIECSVVTNDAQNTSSLQYILLLAVRLV